MPFDPYIPNRRNKISTLLVLIYARELIVEEGWIKNRFEVDNQYCIIGAYRAACRKLAPRLSEAEADYQFGRLLYDQLPFRHRKMMDIQIALASFNDRIWRRKKAVIKLYDRAILAAKKVEA